jgi:hypothetical protein
MSTLEERFWAKVDKTDACWNWAAAKGRHGYGVIATEGKYGSPQLAHRVSWELHNGPIPHHDSAHGMCVLHRCDNRVCVNPGHLFLGTHQDNMTDRDQKGRSAPQVGELNHNAKLTSSIVRAIKQLLICGRSQVSLARHYNVGKTAIADIKHGRTWRTS